MGDSWTVRHSALIVVTSFVFISLAGLFTMAGRASETGFARLCEEQVRTALGPGQSISGIKASEQTRPISSDQFVLAMELTGQVLTDLDRQQLARGAYSPQLLTAELSFDLSGSGPQGRKKVSCEYPSRDGDVRLVLPEHVAVSAMIDA